VYLGSRHVLSGREGEGPAAGPRPAGTNPLKILTDAEQETREIKALSTEEVDGYLKGEGMGLAKAAELNGFPRATARA